MRQLFLHRSVLLKSRSQELVAQSFFSSGENGAYFIANGEDLYTDQPRTTLATTDGDSVLGWTDISGNDNHVIGNLNTPTKQTDGSSKIYVEFSNAGLQLPDNLGISGNGGRELYLVCRQNNASRSALFSLNITYTSNDAWAWVKRDGTDDLRLERGGSASNFTTLVLSEVNLQLIGSTQTNGTDNFTARIDDLTESGTATTNTVAEDNWIGRADGENGFMDLYELLIINRNLTTDERNSYRSYVSDTYGISLS